MQRPAIDDSTPSVEPRTEARLRLLNVAASAAVVACAMAFYALAPQNRSFAARHYRIVDWSFTGGQFLVWAAIAYAAVLGLYFMLVPDPGASKSLRFWQVVAEFLRRPAAFRWSTVRRQDRVAVLATLLKGLFGPLMTMALLTATMGLVGNGLAVVADLKSSLPFREIYDRHLHWFLFQTIVMADVFVFTVGYLVELPRLKNQIRSVDPTWLGWLAALVCYVPLNIVVSVLLGPPGGEFPQFTDDRLHFAMNALLLGLMAVYTWASVALGFKASNLTHRGIVTHGPYRWVRHPAYACKNMAWWIGSVPIIEAAFGRSSYSGVMALGSCVGWALLYVLRAITEEDHLRGVDGEYAAYAATVRYRFVPGLY